MASGAPADIQTYSASRLLRNRVAISRRRVGPLLNKPPVAPPDSATKDPGGEEKNINENRQALQVGAEWRFVIHAGSVIPRRACDAELQIVLQVDARANHQFGSILDMLLLDLSPPVLLPPDLGPPALEVFLAITKYEQFRMEIRASVGLAAAHTNFQHMK